jgi:hypothetical protein
MASGRLGGLDHQGAPCFALDVFLVRPRLTLELVVRRIVGRYLALAAAHHTIMTRRTKYVQYSASAVP